MWLGKIEGRVWATFKSERLEGVRLLVMQPIDEYEEPLGSAVVAVDSVGATEGDLVYWVNSTEASFVFDDRAVPSEVSIVGLIDRLDIVSEEEQQG
jgi:ethanolamine utilization protein EutN